MAQKIKLLEALSQLLKTKPEFLLGMGRLSEDILPLVRIHLDLNRPLTEEEALSLAKLKKNQKNIELRRVEQFNRMDWQLARAMMTFLVQCRTVYGDNKLEDVDQKRFKPVIDEVEQVISQIDEVVDVKNEKVKSDPVSK